MSNGCYNIFRKFTQFRKDVKLAKVNYQYEKRQKELEKKRKKEQKLKLKQQKKNVQPKENSVQVPEVPEKEAQEQRPESQ